MQKWPKERRKQHACWKKESLQKFRTFESTACRLTNKFFCERLEMRNLVLFFEAEVHLDRFILIQRYDPMDESKNVFAAPDVGTA